MIIADCSYLIMQSGHNISVSIFYSFIFYIFFQILKKKLIAIFPPLTISDAAAIPMEQIYDTRNFVNDIRAIEVFKRTSLNSEVWLTQ